MNVTESYLDMEVKSDAMKNNTAQDLECWVRESR